MGGLLAAGCECTRDDADMKKYNMLSRTRMLMNESTHMPEAPWVLFVFLIFLKETLIARKKSKASKQKTGMNRKVKFLLTPENEHKCSPG